MFNSIILYYINLNHILKNLCCKLPWCLFVQWNCDLRCTSTYTHSCSNYGMVTTMKKAAVLRTQASPSVSRVSSLCTFEIYVGKRILNDKHTKSVKISNQQRRKGHEVSSNYGYDTSSFLRQTGSHFGDLTIRDERYEVSEANTGSFWNWPRIDRH